MEVLLYSVAKELWVFFPGHALAPIRVIPGSGNPKVYYEKSTRGEYVVQLTARNRRWAQYAYQFAHEFCHVLSNFERKEFRHGDPVAPNQWFEESLCEAAALFTLKRMAVRWASEAPYPHWAGYAPALREYADRLQSEPHRHAVRAMDLAAWVAQREQALREDPYRRDDNEVCANALLPLFESNPARWEVLRYLNSHPGEASKPFVEYLAGWHRAVPEKHRRFLQQVSALLVPGAVPGTRMDMASSERAAQGGMHN
ncbi:hypothetical protein [Pelomicrobium sp.]|uniref:hypothetical protein n=1 Tax=unclassified Pelomicrobium TaxID=2815318 RepID=UPI002FDEDDAF